MSDRPPLLRYLPEYGVGGILLTAVIDGLLLGAVLVLLFP